MDKKDSYFLTRLNFILAVMIIWHHAYNAGVYNLAEIDGVSAQVLNALESYFSIIQLVAVPLFLFMSGYLFFRNYSWDAVWKKYKSRVHSLVIPYLIWNSLLFAFYYILTHIPFTANVMSMEPLTITPYSLYRNIIWCDDSSAMWFIKSLIILVALSPLFYFVLTRNQVTAWIFVIFSAAAYMVFPIGQHTALFSCAFYLLGGVFALYYPKEVFVNVNYKTGIIALFSFALLNVGFVAFDAFDYQRIRAVLLCVDISLFWVGIRSIKWMNSLEAPPWFFRISFFIFCMHSIVLESVEKLILIGLGKTVFGAYIDYLIAPVITLLIICLTARVLQKWINPVWRILNGQRA